MRITFEVKGGITTTVTAGEIKLEEGKQWTVADLTIKLGLPLHEVGNVAVNGRMAAGKTQLNDGDKIVFYPVIAGG